MSASKVSLLAVELLGRWTQLARRHVPLGAGCACGLGGLQLGDFEQQILDYLRAKHGGRVGASVAELLRGVAKSGDRKAQPLLADLTRSLDSFDELHGVTPAAGSSRRG